MATVIATVSVVRTPSVVDSTGGGVVIVMVVKGTVVVDGMYVQRFDQKV